MLKKLLMLCVALILSISAGFAAAVEVNTADQAALESVKGIGPVHAKAILDERAKNGPFKDADDLATRVKGIGTKSVTNLEAAGLTINGSSTAPTGAKAASTKSTSKAAATPAPATTPTPAANTPATTTAAASDSTATKTKRSKKSKAAASDAAAASAPATAPATAAAASDGKPAKAKKSKKSKAASAAAASGA